MTIRLPKIHRDRRNMVPATLENMRLQPASFLLPHLHFAMSAATTNVPPGTYQRPDAPVQLFAVDQARVSHQDNLRFNQKSLSELDRRRQHRLNHRDSKHSLYERERGLFEREKSHHHDPFHEDVAHGPEKHLYFKPNELRNNFVTGHQLLPPQNLSISPGIKDKEQEDMGSTWVPSLHVRNTSIPRHSSFGVGSTSMPGQLSVSQAPLVTGSHGSRRVNRTSSMTHLSGRCHHREAEIGYADPLIGAPASLQQRLSEMAGLEAETIRWERTKKTKKKSKDS